MLLTWSAGASAQAADWPLWENFRRHAIQSDGRVIERRADDRTTSEAQAYALFFALVANDRAQFERLLSWTQNNLANGDLRAQQPAWLWGSDTASRWRVLDANPAADADFWLAYTLLQAGRLSLIQQSLGITAVWQLSRDTGRRLKRCVIGQLNLQIKCIYWKYSMQ